MHDHWPAAGKQRVEAGVPRGSEYVEAGLAGQQKQTTLPQGCCSHCPADLCGLRHNSCSMQASVTCAFASMLCGLCNMREALMLSMFPDCNAFSACTRSVPHDVLHTAEVSHWRLHLEQQSLQQKPWRDLKDTEKCH